MIENTLINMTKYKPEKKSQSELVEQIRVIAWWDGYSKASNGKYESRMLFHIPNESGGNRTAKQGATLKKAGLRRGVPDLCLTYPAGGYHGLYIEMKSKSGRIRPEQKTYLSMLENAGYATAVCHGSAEAITIISEYLREATDNA